MTNIKEPEKEVAAEGRQPRGEPAGRSLWGAIDEIMRAVPEAVLSRLPSDGSERHDHYLYGTREKEPRETCE